MEKNKIKEIEDMILKEYKESKDNVCGCENISFEDYRKFRLAELKLDLDI